MTWRAERTGVQTGRSKSQTCSRSGILPPLLLLLSSLTAFQRQKKPCLQTSSRRTYDRVALGERRGVNLSGRPDTATEAGERTLDVLDRGGRRGCKGDVEALEVIDRVG